MYVARGEGLQSDINMYVILRFGQGVPIVFTAHAGTLHESVSDRIERAAISPSLMVLSALERI
jgi:hypothetical protein